MKNIIWVFGSSASGKETFLRSLTNNERLQASIGVEDMSLAISEESLKNLGDLNGARGSIAPEVSDLLKSHDTVAIKWQYGDSILGTPNELQKRFPNIKHTAVILNVEPIEQIRRLKTKKWWHDNGEERDFIDKESRLIKDSIRKLDDKIVKIGIEW